MLKLRATLIVPKGASSAKIAALRRYSEEDVELLVEGANYDDAECLAIQVARQTNRRFVSPYNDPQVMVGQGTIGLEILEDLPMFELCSFPLERRPLVGIALWPRPSIGRYGWLACIDSVSFHENCVCGRASRDSPGYGQPSGWHFWKH